MKKIKRKDKKENTKEIKKKRKIELARLKTRKGRPWLKLEHKKERLNTRVYLNPELRKA